MMMKNVTWDFVVQNVNIGELEAFEELLSFEEKFAKLLHEELFLR